LCRFEIWRFQPFVIKRKEPPSIPDDIEKLEEILSERLEIIGREQPKIFGTTSECAIKLRCPFAKANSLDMNRAVVFTI
jgi:hypothetical protein